LTSLAVRGTLFVGNQAKGIGANRDACYGGAIYGSSNATVLITNCTFNNNIATPNAFSSSSGGGGLCLKNGPAVVTCCAFSNNYTIPSGTYAYGGAIYGENMALLSIVSNTFINNYAGSALRKGSALYLTGISTGVVNDCVFDSVGQSGYAEHIYVDSGTTNIGFNNTIIRGSTSHGLVFSNATAKLTMTNCLIVTNVGDGLSLAAGTATVVNCTVAHNAGWGINIGVATVTVRNGIVWGNATGGIYNTATVTYSDVQGGAMPGAGNISANPLFVSVVSNDYHEMSPAGSWHGGAWTRDFGYSPCIDMGMPGDPCDLEPKPSGSRVNMGAYGNTAQASKTGRGTIFTCY
jgi:hypothetical protein